MRNIGETKAKSKKYSFKVVGGTTEKNLSKMDSDFLRRFNNMCAEFKKKTNKEVIVTRSFTTKTEQEKLYKNSLENKTYEKNNPYPQSLHCYGRAIDIQPVFTTMLENLGLLEKYGFIAPFSKERKHIQNINEKDNALSNAGDGLLFKDPIRSRGGESLDSVDVYIKNMFKKGLPKNILDKIEKGGGYSFSELKLLPSFLGGVNPRYVPLIERYQNYLMDIKELRNAVKNKKIPEEKAVQALKEMYSLQDGTVLYHDEARHKSKNIFTGKTSTLAYALENREKSRNKAISETIGAIEQLRTRGTDLVTMIKSVKSIEDAKSLEKKALGVHNEIIRIVEGKLGVTYLNVSDDGVWNFKDNITGETFEFSQSGIDKALQTVKSNSFATTLGIAGAVVGTLMPFPGTTFLGSMMGAYMGAFIDSHISANSLGKNISSSEANEVALDAMLTDGVINVLTFGTAKLIKSFSPVILNPLLSKIPKIKSGKYIDSLYLKQSNKEGLPSYLPAGKELGDMRFSLTDKTTTSPFIVTQGVKKADTLFFKHSSKEYKQFAKHLIYKRKNPMLGKAKRVYKRVKAIGGKIKNFGGLSLKRIAALGIKAMEKRRLIGVGSGNAKRKTTMVPIKNKGKTYYIWVGDFGKDYDKIIKEKKLKEYKLESDENFSELKPIEVSLDEVYKKDIINVNYDNKIKKEKTLQRLFNENVSNFEEASETYLNKFKETGLIKKASQFGNTLKDTSIIIDNTTLLNKKEKPMTKNISTNYSSFLTNSGVSNTTNNFNRQSLNTINNTNNFIAGENKNPQFSNNINMKENSKLIKEFNL